MNNGTNARNRNHANNLPAIDEHVSLRQSSPTRVAQHLGQMQPKQGGYDPASPMRNAAVRRSGGAYVGHGDAGGREQRNESQAPRRNSNGSSNANYQQQQMAPRQHQPQAVPKNWSCGELLGQVSFDVSLTPRLSPVPRPLSLPSPLSSSRLFQTHCHVTSRRAPNFREHSGLCI